MKDENAKSLGAEILASWLRDAGQFMQPAERTEFAGRMNRLVSMASKVNNHDVEGLQRALEMPDLTKLHENGAKAWADVPNAGEWVDEMRGNAPAPAPLSPGQSKGLIEQAIQGHEGKRDAMAWLVRRVEAHHGITKDVDND